ncbi:MAG: hypothetical protein A3G34_03395 [Candidatus Lindowbacteria bacterium RIFCSPLOWO2_12_FULL_62_27]|nr:MAG: hypothetical protein A3I06_07025 [Candidatus Lindowbacteria bacterium RIFCSPLOWO2_02_FULL_62_12]OGH62989.1 MAG: hypothetical protein A3G34_03395 [Candidatus Lindowbacteria bacterium RIFCSPLOWO2_12_FULL_62_27]
MEKATGGTAMRNLRFKQIRYDLKKKIAVVLGGMVLVSTALLLIFSFFWSHYQEKLFIRKSVLASVSGVRAFMARQNNWKSVTNLRELRLILKSVIDSNPYIYQVIVYDDAGGVATYMSKTESEETAPSDAPRAELDRQNRDRGYAFVTVRAYKRRSLLGYVKAELKPERMDLETTVLPSVLVIVVMLILCLSLTYYWAARISRPLREVIQVADEVAEGKSFREVKASGSDEAGVIAGLFNDINRRLQHRIDDLEKLNRLAIDINSELDRVLLHNIIVTKFAEATGARKVALLLCGADQKSPSVAAGINLINPKVSLDMDGGLAAKAISTRGHVQTGDISGHPEHALFYEDKAHIPSNAWYLVLPLTAQGKILGVVIVGEPEHATDHGYDRETVYLYQTFATAAGSALENARLYELAITDELTRVYIRRFFNQRLTDEIDASTKNRTPLSLLMLDIDHFKKVNDTYGHQVGDVVLVALARILTQTVRSIDVREAERRRDIVARLGGEEFSIILPGTSLSAAAAVGERIRAAVETYQDLKFEDGGVLTFTVSIGVAEWPAGQSGEDLIRASDEALYEAKRAGRNRVVASKLQEAG